MSNKRDIKAIIVSYLIRFEHAIHAGDGSWIPGFTSSHWCRSRMLPGFRPTTDRSRCRPDVPSPIHPLVEGRQESRGAAGLGIGLERVGEADEPPFAPGAAEEREADW